MSTRIGDKDSRVHQQRPSTSYLKYSTPFEYLVKFLFEDMTPGTNDDGVYKRFLHYA